MGEAGGAWSLREDWRGEHLNLNSFPVELGRRDLREGEETLRRKYKRIFCVKKRATTLLLGDISFHHSKS